MLPKGGENMEEVTVPTKENSDNVILRNRKTKQSYGIYIYKILQQIHSQMEISNKTKSF